MALKLNRMMHQTSMVCRLRNAGTGLFVLNAFFGWNFSVDTCRDLDSAHTNDIWYRRRFESFVPIESSNLVSMNGHHAMNMLDFLRAR